MIQHCMGELINMSTRWLRKWQKMASVWRLGCWAYNLMLTRRSNLMCRVCRLHLWLHWNLGSRCKARIVGGDLYVSVFLQPSPSCSRPAHNQPINFQPALTTPNTLCTGPFQTMAASKSTPLSASSLVVQHWKQGHMMMSTTWCRLSIKPSKGSQPMVF